MQRARCRQAGCLVLLLQSRNLQSSELLTSPRLSIAYRLAARGAPQLVLRWIVAVDLWCTDCEAGEPDGRPRAPGPGQQRMQDRHRLRHRGPGMDSRCQRWPGKWQLQYTGARAGAGGVHTRVTTERAQLHLF